MMKSRLRIFGLLWISISGSWSCTGQTKSANEMKYADDKFNVGQIWQYETRKGEDASRVLILKIETAKNQVIVHISVINAKIKNPQMEGGISSEIGHLPFSRGSLEKSLTKLESSNNKLPDFRDGYNQWKEAFDSGQGGVFTTSVKEAIDYVEQAMNQ